MQRSVNSTCSTATSTTSGWGPAPRTCCVLSPLLCLPWAVVTSADRRLAKVRLGATGITPPLLVTSEDSSRGKPHPDPYLAAAERLGIDPARCLVVEDSQPGIDAGYAAGATIAALRGLQADYEITDLGDLADRLVSARRADGVMRPPADLWSPC